MKDLEREREGGGTDPLRSNELCSEARDHTQTDAYTQRWDLRRKKGGRKTSSKSCGNFLSPPSQFEQITTEEKSFFYLPVLVTGRETGGKSFSLAIREIETSVSKQAKERMQNLYWIERGNALEKKLPPRLFEYLL